MKLINKTLAFLSLISLAISSLDAKSIEFLLDQQIKGNFNVQDDIPDQNQECPYFQQLKIENLGGSPIRNCFPYANQSPNLSLEDLGRKLSSERYPLLALYQLWRHSITCDAVGAEKGCHPLDLLNFKGSCSPAVFNNEFLKLCNVLGIETRIANVQGKQVYDFGLDDEWNFLDLANNQLYLGLDNEKLASSEEIMDDPFLALRTKHDRQAKQMNFKEAWKQLAAFDILEPASAMVTLHEAEDLADRAKGLDLYPGEALVFETSAIRSDLASHECAIEQIINFDERPVAHYWKYLSVFPLHRLVNNSTTSIHLIDQDIELQPGEAFVFKEDLFQVTLAFADKPKGKMRLLGRTSKTLFPALVKGKNTIHLGAKKNKSLVRFHYEVDEEYEKKAIAAPRILNQTHLFDHCTPQFMLDSSNAEKIWWQIGFDDQFQLIPSNLDQVQESSSSAVSLPLISETFLNPGSTYYFRVKGYRNGQWSDWSVPFAFKSAKPSAVEGVIFEQTDNDEYELNWERYAEESNGSIEYLVFGSQSLDFIPSIYCNSQVNEIVNGEVTEEETNDNLIAITTEPKIRIQGSLAYYRIIARKDGQLSVPSTIIHVYDHDLIQPRNVLQVVKDESQFVAKRILFPTSYPWSDSSLPRVSPSAKFESNILKLQSLLRAARTVDSKSHYEFPNVSEEVWEEVRPYMLPEGHPAWPKLNRIFCRSRATQSSEHFKKAGFRRWRPGRWSRVSASSHPEAPEYFIKAYCDVEIGIIYDWKKWIHRIKGAETIRACIKEYQLQRDFKVPHKWIYPLPKHPSPPKSSQYLRKNFILVCENMRILEHSANEKKYKKEMTRKVMDDLYIILQVCGLYDSVYVFNMPFTKDGRIAIIDTEYHHKWPVPFQKLTKYFPKHLQSHWKKITFRGGKIPNGKTLFNPPRMDRRDAPMKDPLKRIEPLKKEKPLKKEGPLKKI